MAESRHLDLPRGFHDATPARMKLYRSLQHDWFETCGLAGYQPVMAPPIGFAETFTTGHHAAGQKLYRFDDPRGRDLALVSDSLPAILRLAHSRKLPEQRLSYCCQVWRYERRPRRHFHHLGLMETRDQPSTLTEQVRAVTRLLELLSRFLASRLTPVVTIFDPGLWYAIAASLHHTGALTSFVDVLRRLPSDQRPALLHRHHASAEIVHFAELVAIDPALGSVGNHVGALPSSIRERLDTCQELADRARDYGADVIIDHSELHSSEFHDGPAFTVRPRDEPRLLGDGGIYGRFASALVGSSTSAAAAIIGLERLTDLIGATHEPTPAADIAVLSHPHREAIGRADRTVASLRNSGIAVWDLILTKPLRRHLRDLACLAIPQSVVIGTKELYDTEYVVRTADGTLYTVAQANLTEWLLNRKSTTSDL